MGDGTSFKKSLRMWQILTALFILISVGLLVALVIVAVDDDDDESNNSVSDDSAASSVCGQGSNPNGYVIDLREPESPGPFDDLSTHELKKLREFLENDTNIHAAKNKDANVTSSNLWGADLLLANKQDILNHLDNGGPKPDRRARVIMFRGDLEPAVVQEYECGPLPDVTSCTLLTMSSRRNPVEFTVRPLNDLELIAIFEVILLEVDKKMNHILQESFQATFTSCETSDVCLTYNLSPVGTGLHGNMSRRLMWLPIQYDLDCNFLHSLDFGLLLQLDLPDPSTWTVDKLWYNGRLFDSVDSFVDLYDNGSVTKQTVVPPTGDDALFSTLKQRGTPQPPKPQRAPTLVEPDGKRYSLRGRKVEYMGWTFNFRLSSLNGPFLYDVSFQGERIAYEMGLSEMAVFYSGRVPFSQTVNYVDSGLQIGTHSKALIPGGDCPESATFINQTFLSQTGDEPASYENALCLFEQNNGYPLRRHLAYQPYVGGFYGGLLDSALTLRAALTIGNYDYIVDFILHQNGVIETRFMSTGYMFSTFKTVEDGPYGFNIHNNMLANLHHHVAHFKVDLDVGGTSNRYETVDIHNEEVELTLFPGKKYHQNAFTRNLKETEKQALYKYSFDVPKYHIVHNNATTTDLDQLKAYRIQLNGNSNWLYPAGSGNEPTVAWARQQLAVTVHKDDEFMSTSNYGFFDGLDPVVKFDTFYEDDENIVDKDLVFWITMGMHHVPHTEDIPVTPTVGNHLAFFLLPYNYFPECPSMGSRDAIYVEHKNLQDPTQGVTLTRYSDSSGQCTTPDIYLDLQMAENPDIVLQSRRKNNVQ